MGLTQRAGGGEHRERCVRMSSGKEIEALLAGGQTGDG